MPTYEYVCDACEHRFERFQKISERPVKRCPECGADRARRIISAGGGLVFKGPGFYATDYRKSSSPSGDGKGESSSKETTKRGSDGGDASDEGGS